MSVLLMRLAAPLQSWGVYSKFDRRDTGRAPTKSGVLGLCAAAMGYHREESDKLERLSALRYGVRIDKEGVLLGDLQLAHEESFWDPVNRSKINRDTKSSSYLTTRYYLMDAAFLVGLEGNDDILHDIEEALRSPMYPLYLGRRGCPPEGRVLLGIVSKSLHEALEEYPSISLSSRSYYKENTKRRVLIDTSEKNDTVQKRASYLTRDFPLSFNPDHRRYDYRRVHEYDVDESPSTRVHDAIATVEEVYHVHFPYND